MMPFLRKSLIVFTSAIVALLLCHSVEVSAKVPSNPPPVCEHFPTQVNFSDISANSVNVSWLDLGAGYQYQVGWRMKNTNSWIISPVIASPNAQYVINNLTKDREYEVQVRAKCQNEASFSNFAPVSLGFRTLKTPVDLCTARVPSPPSEVKISSLGSDQSVIRWKNIPDASGTVVVYGLVSESPSKWKEVILCKNIDSLVIKNLNPNQNYRVRVRTLCNQCSTQNGNAKKSGWTNILDFRTLSGNAGTQVVGGLVYNEKLQPIKGAKVTVNGQSTTTDARGRYFTRLIWKERSLVKAEHPDYNTRTVGFFPTNGDTVFCSVLMEQFTVTHTFNGKDAMLLGNTAFTVQLPENAIMDEATRQPYTGTVKACIKSAQPGDPLFGERMPGGDFLALDAQNREVVLYSYGFFGCELRGENNQKLNLAPGKKAQVAFKITTDRLAKSQPMMPLWHFDESNSIWKEEGTTRKEGQTYIGEVSHFSSWNCDWQGPRAWVEGTLLDCDGKKAVGGIVYTDYMPAEADNNGFYRRWVPAGLNDLIRVSVGGLTIHTLPSKLNEGQTYKVPTYQATYQTGNSIFANGFGYIDLDHKGHVEIYATDAFDPQNSAFEYSSDSITWQSSNKFDDLPAKNEYIFWIKHLNTGCRSISSSRIKIKPVIMEVYQNCELRPTELLKSISINDPRLALTYTQYVESLRGGGSTFIGVQGYMYDFDLVYPALSCINYIYVTGSGTILVDYMKRCIEPMSYFSNLQVLKIDQMSVSIDTILTPSIGKLTNLEILSLNLWSYKSLPQEFENLTKLRHLILTGSFAQTLPKEVCSLNRLEKLEFMYHDSLSRIPSEISNLTGLKILNLSGNRRLQKLPSEIANLKDTLQELNLSRCPISPTEQAKIRAWLPNTTIIF